jgi:hypothetical protein
MSFRVIDFHTHAWPKEISARARENLEKLFKVTLVGDPTTETLLSYMDTNGIAASVVCGVATKPAQVPVINDWMCAIRSERLRVYCAMHPMYPEWAKELGRIRARGDGIKLQPEFQDFYVDDPAVFPLYEELQRLKLPVLFHCGEELSHTMLVRSSPARIARVKEQFPRLTIIAAHFGGFSLWEETKEHLLGKDIYMDTSYFLPYFSKEDARDLLLKHPAERLLFGTDFPLVDQKQDLARIAGLGLDAYRLERLLFLNAQELLGIAKEVV